MSRYVEVQVDEVLRETDKAVLCRIDGVETWLPFSQISAETPAVVGECDVAIEITKWIAEEKGLS